MQRWLGQEKQRGRVHTEAKEIEWWISAPSGVRSARTTGLLELPRIRNQDSERFSREDFVWRGAIEKKADGGTSPLGG